MVAEFRQQPRDEATEKIEAYIAENGLAPHTRLPSERDMCGLWGFNRTTLRSAIRRLIVRGRLYQRKSSGTFVASPKLVRNLQNLQPFGAVVAEAGKNLTARVIGAQVVECNRQISQKLHLPLGHRVFELTRLRLVDAEPLIIETCYVDHERYPALESHDFARESLYGVLEDCCGVRITKGEEQLGITYATGEEAELLGIAAGTAMFFLTGTVSDPDNVPLEYFKSVVRADRVCFTSRLRENENTQAVDFSTT